MAEYPPPEENLTVFNSSVFSSPDDTISKADADILYLGRLGTPNSVASATTFAGTVSLAATNTITNATYYPTFVSNSTGATILSKSSANPISVNPSTGDFRICQTFKIQTTGANSGVSIGGNAGQTNQGTGGTAIGTSAGQTNQGAGAVAIGIDAGQTTQGTDAVAIGNLSGSNTQGASAVAIGNQAAQVTQGGGAVAIGYGAGYSNQAQQGVGIGINAGSIDQSFSAVAIGSNAGTDTQGTNSVAIGNQSGQTNQGDNAVAIGKSAGYSTQGTDAVAIGIYAGQTTQGDNAVAIGNLSGSNTQGTDAVAIGNQAAQVTQGGGAVAIGYGAGYSTQGTDAVAIGKGAGQTTQGNNAIAIGFGAGFSNQTANSICLNGSGIVVNPSTAGLYVRPITSVALSSATNYAPLFYNTSSYEVSSITSSSLKTFGTLANTGMFSATFYNYLTAGLVIPIGTYIVEFSIKCSMVGSPGTVNSLKTGLSTATGSFAGGTGEKNLLWGYNAASTATGLLGSFTTVFQNTAATTYYLPVQLNFPTITPTTDALNSFFIITRIA